jgi:putative nucleotidyltransferase with HDIG domain
MYIQGFDGSWFDHPFWRTRFVLDCEHDVARVRDCGVEAVIIDDALGCAPEPVRSARSAEWTPPTRREPAAKWLGNPIPTVRNESFATEYGRAAKVLGKSKRAVTAMFSDVRLGKAIKAERLAPLVAEITTSIDSNPRAFISIAQLKARHEYTYMHSVAVCALMINLARELRFGEEAVREAGMAGLLHDIGKAVMPLEIIDKPGALTDDEFGVIKSHPVRGHDLLRRSSGVSHHALDVCLRHHEKFDGSGYPDGLAGDRLSLFARMSALCDVYDAVTSERAYKDPWTPIETIARMREWTGHFDPEMFELFVKSVGIYPIGALVRLKSGRAAMVIGENSDDPTCPPLLSIGPDPERIAVGTDEITGMESAQSLQLDGWETTRTQLIRRFHA